MVHEGISLEKPQWSGFKPYGKELRASLHIPLGAHDTSIQGKTVAELQGLKH